MNAESIESEVMEWATDRDYKVLDIVPKPPAPGYMPHAALLIEREHCIGGIPQPQFVVWTAVVYPGGDVSCCWGHYHNTLEEARKSLAMKKGNRDG